MIYQIVKQDAERTTWYLDNPPFVRLANDNTYSLTNEPNAHGVYIDGVVYHIVGRAPIQGLEEVMIGVSSAEVYSNYQVKQKLDAQYEIQVQNDFEILDHEERLILLEVGE